jgi:DNA-binding transcriptional ArsR family regulator/intracellular sulfur oxidation DsrE/DsrF family protein
MFDQSLVTTKKAEDTARLLRALANPRRLLILCRLLTDGETSAGELAARLHLSASALSQHLARMSDEHLVVPRRAGRKLYYRISDQLDGRLPAVLESICDVPAAPQPDAERTNRAAAVVGLAFGATLGVADDDGWQTPVIDGAGRIRPLPHAAYQPDPDASCKAVFAIIHASERPGDVNKALERLARTVNLYVNAGVPAARLEFVAVASGRATAIALDDVHYKERHGVDNPNLPVIRQLRAAGVDVAVCGQAVIEHHYALEWIDGDVTVALSALTTITQLQQRGYALMPL